MMICARAIRRGNHLFRRRIFTVRRDDFTIRDNALFILVVEFITLFAFLAEVPRRH